MAWDVIIKNNSGGNIVLNNLGIEIQNSTQIVLSDYFEYSDITDDDELKSYVAASELVVNDGVSDLSASEGVLYLTRDNLYNDFKNHYTKTELSTPNSSVIDWTNIVNAPSFGSPKWDTPVNFRVITIDSAPVGVPENGDVYVDTDDMHYYKYDGSSWNDIGSVAVNDRVVNLATSASNIFSYDGSSWNDLGQPADNTAIMVNDDGDGKNAQYVYSTESLDWFKIADVDFDDHLDGGPNKHDASEIDVEGTYSNISGTPTDLESVISEINTQLTEALDNNTLDGAYDEGGAGAGRIIIADSGPVVIDTDSALTSPFEIKPKGSLPTNGLSEGQMAVKDGILFIYDGTRGKWLSVQRQYVVFGRRRNVRNQYLNFAVGNLPSNNSGYRIMRDACIISMSCQLDAAGTCDINVRKNDTYTNILTLSLNNVIGVTDSGVNMDINANDFLQCYLSAPSFVNDPVVIMEIAYRA